uniref:Putative Glycosyltransferase, family 4 n=1 Tax=mine drainage metagenome TaxID=410659 RepID=E6Q6X4_9ZZZZ
MRLAPCAAFSAHREHSDIYERASFAPSAALQSTSRGEFALRILLLNWRDPWHPRAGGAEILTHRVLTRLAKRGWEIDWFSASYPGVATEDIRDGIKFIRAGTQLSVHIIAYQRFRNIRTYDVVIDQVNTIPFFACKYAVPSIAWFQQLAREVWLYEGPRVFRRAGYMLEPWYLVPYRHSPVITISRSTALSLREIGFRGEIRIIPMAADEEPVAEVAAKSCERDVIVLGRVTPSKRIEESIAAVARLVQYGWHGKLHVVGATQPSYERFLRRRAHELGVADQIVFHGRVEPERRGQLLREASVLWMTSVREGWGMAVTEAASSGTPAIVYDVPGLRDSVINGVTGRVILPDPEALAKATAELFDQATAFGKRALSNARLLSWDNTANAFEAAIREILALASRQQ